MTAQIEVLVVDDSEASARLTLEALRDANRPNRVSVVYDGEEALKFLRRESPYGSAPRPHLILLDLNLPKIDGREVLTTIKADNLLNIPVVVLTVSSNPEDVEFVYRNQAAGYMEKNVDLDQFFMAIRLLKQLWFTMMTLPSSQASAETSA